MAHTIGKSGDPYIAASAIGAFKAVVRASGVAHKVHPATALLTVPVLGLSLATAASPGDGIAVAVDGQQKALAAGSIAAGDAVGVGSINGALVKFTPGTATSAAAMRYAVGYAVTNAGAGDIFTVDVAPFASL